MLPKNDKMKKWFAQHGIPDVNAPQYMQCIPAQCHIGQGSVHANEDGIPGTNWNALWQQWMKDHDEATPADILNYLDELKRMFRKQLECKE